MHSQFAFLLTTIFALTPATALSVCTDAHTTTGYTPRLPAFKVAHQRPDSTGTAPGLAADGRLAKGRFLIAHQNTNDPNFRQTVLIITRYDATGTIALIINRPLPVRVQQAIPSLQGHAIGSEQLFAGGPVATNSLQILLRSGNFPGGGEPIVGDVHLLATRDQLRQLSAGDFDSRNLRLFAGYAGWAPGQLESELLRGDWYLSPGDADELFTDTPESLWQDLIDRATSLWVRDWRQYRQIRPSARLNSTYNYPLMHRTGILSGWHRGRGKPSDASIL